MISWCSGSLGKGAHAGVSETKGLVILALGMGFQGNYPNPKTHTSTEACRTHHLEAHEKVYISKTEPYDAGNVPMKTPRRSHRNPSKPA